MSTTIRRTALAATALALAAGLTACGSDAPSASSSLSGTVTVFAAASLEESFSELGKNFQAAHPGVTVRFNFGGSSALARSIVSGAPADVFAAASPKTMKTVTDAKAATDPTVFVRNTLTIAVPKGNPRHIAALKDLAGGGLKVAVCAKEVPCGAAAVDVLKAGAVDLTPVTLEQDVKGALTKVELGEVDAALVYRTDVIADAAKIDGVDFPEAAQAVNDYPIATLRSAPNADAAAAFTAYVQSADARRVLTAAGFRSP